MTLLAVAGSGGCDSLVRPADATVELSVEDPSAIEQLRTHVLNTAPGWGATRIGEESEQGGSEASLTFSLPGPRLEQALTALDSIEDAEVVATDLDVEAAQLDRAASDPDPVELRVELVSGSASTKGAASPWLRMVMAVFSVLGMVMGGLWVYDRFRSRSPRHYPNTADHAVRTIKRPAEDDVWLDLSSSGENGPDTQENPTVRW